MSKIKLHNPNIKKYARSNIKSKPRLLFEEDDEEGDFTNP